MFTLRCVGLDVYAQTIAVCLAEAMVRSARRVRFLPCGIGPKAGWEVRTGEGTSHLLRS